MFIRRAFWAGEPHWNTPDDGGSGSATSGDEGAGNEPSQDSDPFDKGYGKGIEKGKRELLKTLGVDSVDDLKSAMKAAQEAREAQRKAAEEQGEFRELYEQLRAENATLKERAAIADRYEASQQKELEGLTGKLNEEDKAMLDGLPTDRALALAKRLAAQSSKPVGSGPAGNGSEPNANGVKDLAYYEKKGYENLTPEERAEADRLEAEQYNKTTVADLIAQRNSMG